VAAVALYFFWYNFRRVHQTLRVTPALEAGIADQVWSNRRNRRTHSVRRLTYLAFAFFATVVACGVIPFRIAAGVTAERIRTIRPGMTEADLLRILGTPLSIEPSGPNGRLVFYSHDTPLLNHSPTLWVHVENGIVGDVEAKRTVWFVDDEGLYVRREGLSWESPAFAKTFR
jgi:hypothetical protein